MWPPNGATLGPLFTLQVTKNNFTPSLELEGKPNLAGYGHYHVFVDMPMMDMAGGGDTGLMSMGRLIGMSGTGSIPVDLTAWPNGRHTAPIEPLQNAARPRRAGHRA